MPKPKVFISYAHRDEPEFPGRDDVKWLSYVKGHLAPLSDASDVEFWADTNLLGSQDWETRIFAAIDACDIFILLVSSHSLGSDFIKSKEIPRILERHALNGSAETPALYPILLTPCAGLRAYPWLRTPNMRPKDGKALSEFEMTAGKDERNRVMAWIGNDIARIAQTLGPSAIRNPSSPPGAIKEARPATIVGQDIPPVSGSYDFSPPQQSQGASGLDHVLREVLLCLTFSGLSRITTKHGTLVFSIRQALLHTTITGGRIAATRRAFPEGWRGPRAQVTRIGTSPIRETLRIHGDEGLDGEVLAGPGDSGHLRLFDMEPNGDALAVSGEVHVTYEAVHVDLDRSDTPRKRRNMKSERRKQIEAELAKLILEECGLTRLPLEGITG